MFIAFKMLNFKKQCLTEYKDVIFLSNCNNVYLKENTIFI